MAEKKWTKAADKADDKKRGIKDGSQRDNALDKKRGVGTGGGRRVGKGGDFGDTGSGMNLLNGAQQGAQDAYGAARQQISNFRPPQKTAPGNMGYPAQRPSGGAAPSGGGGFSFGQPSQSMPAPRYSGAGPTNTGSPITGQAPVDPSMSFGAPSQGTYQQAMQARQRAAQQAAQARLTQPALRFTGAPTNTGAPVQGSGAVDPGSYLRQAQQAAQARYRGAVPTNTGGALPSSGPVDPSMMLPQQQAAQQQYQMLQNMQGFQPWMMQGANQRMSAGGGDVGRGGGRGRAVGKGAGMPPMPMPPGGGPPMPGGGPPMPPGGPPGALPPMPPGGGAPPGMPPGGAGGMPPPMPLPPGVKVPKPKVKKKPMRPGMGPGKPPAGPIVPGVGGGRGKTSNPVNLKSHSTTGPVKGGQRDKAGNAKPGVNSSGKKIGGRAK